jgi:hypothetical protein
MAGGAAEGFNPLKVASSKSTAILQGRQRPVFDVSIRF